MERRKPIGMLLSQVSHAHGMKIRERVERYGIQKAFGPALHELEKNEGITQAELAGLLHISPPTVSVTLQHLEELGYITRIQNKDDARQTNLYLTEEGHNTVGFINQTFVEVENEFISVLTQQEVDELYRLLNKLYDNAIPPEKQQAYENRERKKPRITD